MFAIIARHARAEHDRVVLFSNIVMARSSSSALRVTRSTLR